MRTLLHKHIVTPDRSGFTLLELLMVVTILSAVAWMSLGLVNNNMNQVRFDDTKNRLETIKRAIIGDTSRSINGQPEIRGYVADMGNLPPSLQGLIQREYCEDFPEETTPSACSTAGGTWEFPTEYCLNHSSTTPSACVTASSVWVGDYCTDYTSTDAAACTGGFTWVENYYVFDKKYGLWTGWNGPYLNAKELLDYAKFRDGWGNLAATGTPAMNNFGWNATIASTLDGDLTIQSLGVDGDTGGTDTYEVDYPPSASSTLVEENEYTTIVTTEGTATDGDGVGHITVDFGTPEPCWGCWDENLSTPAYNGVFNRKDCENTSGQFWRPKLGVNDEGSCVGDPAAVGPWTPVDGTWLQTTASTEKICLKIAYRDEGELMSYSSVDTVTGTPAEPFNLSAESTFTWDGSQQELDFVFLDNTQLPMGILSYNIHEYEVAEDPHCSTDKFQVESTSWTPLTIVPGTSTTPLNWKLQ